MLSTPEHSSVHSLESRTVSLYHDWYLSPFRLIEIATMHAMYAAYLKDSLNYVSIRVVQID